MITLTLGTVDTGKSMRIIMFYHKLKSIGKKVSVFVPAISMQRDGEDSKFFIKSRASNTALECSNIKEMVNSDADYYLIDECQFLSKAEVEIVDRLAHEQGKQVYLYGLKNDFKGKMFSASVDLFEIADSYHEMSSLCLCGSLATISAKIGNDGSIIKKGDSISPGYDFVPMCRTCWYKQDRI